MNSENTAGEFTSTLSPMATDTMILCFSKAHQIMSSCLIELHNYLHICLMKQQGEREDNSPSLPDCIVTSGASRAPQEHHKLCPAPLEVKVKHFNFLLENNDQLAQGVFLLTNVITR